MIMYMHSLHAKYCLSNNEKQCKKIVFNSSKRNTVVTKFLTSINSFILYKLYIIILVMVRTIIEAAFLWLQFYLFGFEVPMVYNCHARPCPTVTECWVSRAYEKTIFLYFMFIIGK